MRLQRRSLLLGGGAAGLVGLGGCGPPAGVPRWPGGWVGAEVGRGHLLRERKSGSLPEPAVQRRSGALIVGAGIAGLGAARTFLRAGLGEFDIFDLEAEAGGNSRGHAIAGISCPLGAHYLPVPGAPATEVAELLEDLGLARREHGRTVYDERHLCHSPQERLFIDGSWYEGLLPPPSALPLAERAAALADYRRFEGAIAGAARHGYAVPTARAHWTSAHDALDRVTFAAWLDAEGYHAPALRWYLDYCCRDDYGAAASQVSAWAGIHYFASRHGFHARGEPGADEREGLLTWPEGNAWLSQRLAAPLGARWHASMLALRVVEGRHDVSVDFWNVAAARLERWSAPQAVLAVPIFVAARLCAAPPPALAAANALMRYAPWLVANLHLDRALADRPGAAPAWDNVVYRGRTLGYVDATHQSLLPYAGATVLTVYQALGGASPAELAAGRARLLQEPWSAWAEALVAEIASVHPDLAERLQRVDLMRYGHAMSIPVPGLRGSPALAALAAPQPRVQFGHADLAGYSVFEEALYHGTRAAQAALRKQAGAVAAGGRSTRQT